MVMSVEVALGAVLGIGATVVGVYTNHYFEEKREDRKVKAEEWKETVDEVYSPLLFSVMQVRSSTLLLLKALGGTLEESSGKITEDPSVTSIPSLFKGLSRSKQSKLFEDILRKRSRLTQPSNLWLDLFIFYSFLKQIELFSSMIASGTYSDNLSQLLVVVQFCTNMGQTLDDASQHLMIALGKFIVSTRNVEQTMSYKTFFTEDVKRTLQNEMESALKEL
jgi:hypothetical protein